MAKGSERVDPAQLDDDMVKVQTLDLPEQPPMFRGQSSEREERVDKAFTRWGINKTLWVTILISALNSMDMNLYLATFVRIQDDLGYSDGRYALLIIIRRAMNLVYGPFWMHVGTLYPPYRMLGYAFILVVIGNIGFACSTSFEMLCIFVIIKAAARTMNSYFVCILDIYGEPERRVWWTQMALIMQFLFVIFSLAIGTYVNWRIAHGFMAFVIALTCAVTFYIDGPKVLPRANEDAEVDSSAFLTHFKNVCMVPRVLWGMILLNIWFALGTVHVEFFAKFAEVEFDWGYETTAFITGPIFIVAGCVGKYIGATIIDKRKNEIGLDSDSRNRDKLFIIASKSGIVPFTVYAIANSCGWFLGIPGFLGTAAVQAFTTGYFPDYNFTLWSGSLDLSAYILPTGSYVYNIINIALTGLTGVLRDSSDRPWPVVYTIVGCFTWVSTAMLMVSAWTDWIPANYEYKLTGQDHEVSIERDSFSENMNDTDVVKSSAVNVDSVEVEMHETTADSNRGNI